MSLPLMPKIELNFNAGGISLMSCTFRLKKSVEVGKDIVEQHLAEEYLKQLQKELKAGNLRLKPLTPFSIAYKKRQGMAQPTIPLYGKGEGNRRSLISGIVVSRTKARGMRVEPSKRKTHHSGVRMEKFILSHAKGYTTRMGVVPPRDPFKAVFKKFRVEEHRFLMAKKIKRKIRRLWK